MPITVRGRRDMAGVPKGAFETVNALMAPFRTWRCPTPHDEAEHEALWVGAACARIAAALAGNR